MAAAVFCVSLVLLIYVYVGYPLCLLLLSRLRPSPVTPTNDEQRRITLIISAYNEEATIGDKLQNALASDYPSDKLEIVVVSDGSDDRTDEIVASFALQGVRLLRMTDRAGKTAGLNKAAESASGEVLVFSDANAMYRPDALTKINEGFNDPDVGAVIGESSYTDVNNEAERSEGLYWRYEVWMKVMESSIGSVVGGDGAIYGVLRSLYKPMRHDALSDFVNPLQVVDSGHRCIYQTTAVSSERAAGDFAKEFRRKIRIVNRAWRATISMRHLLNPFNHGWFSIQLISHKLLRWWVPAMLLALLISNARLLGGGWIWSVLMLGQLAFYGLAIAGWLRRDSDSSSAALHIPFYFCLVNVASAIGIFHAFQGKTYTTWTTPREQLEAGQR